MHGKLLVTNHTLTYAEGVTHISEDDVGDFLLTLDRKVDVDTIRFDGKRLSDDALSVLVSAILRASSLVSLDLSCNYLTDVSISLLAECMASSLPFLRFLDVSNNHIGPEGCCSLVQVFFPDFSDTQPSHDTSCTVSISPLCGRRESISRCVPSRLRDSVYFLDISDNCIGPEGVFAVAEVKCRQNSNIFVFRRKLEYETDSECLVWSH